MLAYNLENLCLKDVLAERGERQFCGKLRGRVADVERWVDFDQIECDKPPRVGDEFHDHVRLAVIEAARGAGVPEDGERDEPAIGAVPTLGEPIVG